LDWPELHGKFGELMMKERCRMSFAATGFRLRTQDQLNVQLSEFKYGGNRQLAKQWGMWLGHKTPPPKDSCRIILAPVPLHWRKQWKRGYNQAEWIAKGVACAWGCEVSPELLLRHRHYNSMTGMNRSDRVGIVRNLYTVNPAARQTATSIIVVDDVMTTGATMAECGHAIKQSGLKWFGGLTLALA
tara:strand:- start:1279 stop:1839 length:561 start_codon:yes stop_codon:yes gene_type:complete